MTSVIVYGVNSVILLDLIRITLQSNKSFKPQRLIPILTNQQLDAGDL